MRRKGFAHIILIILLGAGLLIFGFAAVKGYLHDLELKREKSRESGEVDKSQGKDKEMANWLRDLSLSEDIPACPKDGSALFTKTFLDGDKPDYIIPLGNSNMTGHVVPVDHVYPNNLTYQSQVPVYAPGKLTLIWVENKQIYNAETNEKLGPDWQLNFAPCRGMNLAFIHITGLSEKLRAAIHGEEVNCQEDKISIESNQENIPSYYRTCHPDIDHVQLEPGELIGTFGDMVQSKQYGFDIGLYNYNTPPLAFVSPNRYYVETLHAVCFADYYTPELKAKYQAKFGEKNLDKSSMQQVVIPRTKEPVCGQVMYDLAGSIAGDWFKNPVKMNNITDNDALVLIHNNIDPDLAEFSWAQVTNFNFIPTHSGQYNREFSEVKADGKLYCYSREEVEVNEKFIIQLIDNQKLKVEKQIGKCGANEVFKNPVNFIR